MSGGSDLPMYERVSNNMLERRSALAKNFSQQILRTIEPFLEKPVSKLRVLDLGSGYGFTANELADHCREVIGLEPSETMVCQSRKMAARKSNLKIVKGTLDDELIGKHFDLIILDNVLEHISDQRGVLQHIAERLNPGGILFLLVPNKLWPIEVHYHLPFLSYLPLRLANLYLRITGNGGDYSDACYAPSYWRLNKLLAERGELTFQYALPADIELAGGVNSIYRIGLRLIRHFPIFWCISKSFLVIGKKHR